MQHLDVDALYKLTLYFTLLTCVDYLHSYDRLTCSVYVVSYTLTYIMTLQVSYILI